MSGHSKWANIKRKKEANDKVKGNLFAKLSRLISLAVVEGGGIPDPVNNVKLRIAIEKARASNMPKDNIQRAIEKGTGKGGEAMKEVIYEGFGPGGSGLMIVATTDNPNRTASEVRNVLDLHNAKLGSQGAVSYLFEKVSLVIIPKTSVSEDQAFSYADKYGVIDFIEDADSYIYYFPYASYGKLNADTPFPQMQVEVVYKPQTVLSLDTEKSASLQKLMDALEEMDDIQNVFNNVA